MKKSKRAAFFEPALYRVGFLSGCLLLVGFTIHLNTPASAEKNSISIHNSGLNPGLMTPRQQDNPWKKIKADEKQHSDFETAVHHYRQQKYQAALPDFKKLVQKYPQKSEYWYYLAITEAQLGYYTDAKRHYQAVIQVAPESQAADLAKHGLAHLPEQTALDSPPAFQNAGRSSGSGNNQSDVTPQNWQAANQTQAGWPSSGMPPGIQKMMQNQPPQNNRMRDMQALQMMLGNNAGYDGMFFGQPMPGNQAGMPADNMTLMLPFLMSQQYNGRNNTSDANNNTMSEMMNTMMMNQLFQGMTSQ
ncbi:MAG: tetratricopeptide repeat protein [Cyanobacteria bacterium P01_H01_bin.74]